MLKVDKYSLKGVKTGEEALPKVFDVEVNKNFLAQAIRIYEERGHIGLRSTKTRSEVNRTTKKFYKQKGTGGARHGSRRANVFVGGGIVFGPRPLRRELTISAQMKIKSRLTAIAAKVGQKELILVEDLSKLNKTKIGAELTKNLTEALKSKRFTFLLSDSNAKVGINLRNLKNATSIPFKDANAFDIWRGGMVVVDKEVFTPQVEKVEKVEKVSKAKTEKAVKKPSNKVTK